MRFLLIITLLFSFSSFGAQNEQQEVETFFINYLKTLRSKKEDQTKSMLTKQYLKNIGGVKGLKKLISMQDGGSGDPGVKLKITKGVDEGLYLVELTDKDTKESEYLFKVIKDEGAFKVDGTQLKED